MFYYSQSKFSFTSKQSFRFSIERCVQISHFRVTNSSSIYMNEKVILSLKIYMEFTNKKFSLQSKLTIDTVISE